MKLFKLSSMTKDLGGFHVARLLPQIHLHSAGPFVFLDHLGPAVFPPGKGMDVRPHPHIGLSTVTYLFSGKIHHRDSLGNILDIAPGDVNWMTAGSGIVHSERTPPDLRVSGQTLHGLQMWIALPKKDEDISPSFHHHPRTELPFWEEQDHSCRLILGEAFQKKSPVQIHSNLFYLDLHQNLSNPLKMTDFLPREYQGEGQFSFVIYPLEGTVQIHFPDSIKAQIKVFDHLSTEQQSPDHEKNPTWSVSAKQFACFQIPAHQVREFLNSLTLTRDAEDTKAHYVLFGGEELAESRHIFWNFVSSSKEKIETAKQLWHQQKMGQVPGETEFIPLP
ncbi:MAG: pirin family protein [Pseudobdellovibrionaceae bacterium]